MGEIVCVETRELSESGDGNRLQGRRRYVVSITFVDGARQQDKRRGNSRAQVGRSVPVVFVWEEKDWLIMEEYDSRGKSKLLKMVL